MPKKKTHEEYVEELKIINPTVEVVGKYINANTKITHHCLVHDMYWDMTPHNALAGKGCKYCAKDKFKSKRARTHDEYISELKMKNPTVEVIEQYVDANTSIMHHCLIHDVYWRTTPTRALQGVGCDVCHGERISSVKYKTNEQYIAEVNGINQNIIVIEPYIDARTPILHKCKIHNVEWMAAPDSILHGHGCPECGNEAIAEKLTKTHKQYVEELKEKNQDIMVIGVYIDALTPILHKCKIDGCEWFARPANILNGNGCPQCNESSGERQVRQWLDNNDVRYECQKAFNDCRDKQPLPFDFYLPDYNICIEYDGKQHYESINYFGGKETYEYTIRHDRMKDDYCKENNITLLRIPYYEDVNEQLNNFLFI